MIWPLFMRNVSRGFRLLLPFFLIIVMYEVIIIYMFDPDLAATLLAYQDSMAGMMAAFGMVGMATDLLSFIHIYLYGFIFPLMPLIFSMMLMNQLMTKDIDSGAIAQLLATPHRRASIIRTHIFTFVFCMVLLFVLSTLVGILASEWYFPGELLISRYLLLNGAELLLQLALGGICFLGACLSTNSHFYWAFGAGLPLIFYLLQMLSQMGEALEALQYATIFSLFPGKAIVEGTDMPAVVMSMGALALLACALFTLGSIIFCHRSFSV